MRVLIADDDQFILGVLNTALVNAGHEVEMCGNVDAAIAVLGEQGGFEVVVTDIVMPGQDGTYLARHVKQNYPHIPVIAMTAGMENAVEDYVNMADMFADETLEKPFNSKALIDVIERLTSTKAA